MSFPLSSSATGSAARSVARKSRRAFASPALDRLESRWLPSAVDHFIGVTPPVGGVQELETFDSSGGGTLTAVAPVTGLNAGDVLFAIASDPVNGKLYGVGVGGALNHGQLYAINPTTGAATAVGAGFAELGLDAIDVDGLGSIPAAFDPASGDLRVMSFLGANATVDPATGSLLSTDADVLLSPTIPQGLAYTNNVAGATQATAYLTDEIGDLDRLGSPGGEPNGAASGQLNPIGNGGAILTGPGRQLVIDAQGNGFEYGSLLGTTPTLVSVNLATGALTDPVGLSGTLLDFTLAPATAAAFVVTGYPANAVAGATANVTVTAVDSFGNPVPGYAGMVHVTSSDGKAVLPPDATLTGGADTFPVTLKTAGLDSVTATDAADPALTGTEAGIAVSPAPTSQFSLTPVAGAPNTYAVTALDAYGNPTPAYSGTVHLTSSDPAALLPASAAITGGEGAVRVILETPGTHSITATDATNPGITGTVTGVATLTIGGTVYLDTDAGDTFSLSEPGLAGRVVFLDINRDGTLDPGDPTAVTDAYGHYILGGGVAGTYPVLEATGQDSAARYVVDQTQVVIGTENIGVVPYSPVAPVPVVPSPFAGVSPTDPNSAYVESLYHAVLGRVGGPTEVASWLARMQQGMTTAQVALGFVNSQEHRADQVAAYYEDFLHRAPDPYAGAWVTDLEEGAPEEKVAEAILDSAEYQSAHQDPTLFIRDLYIDVLGRQGDPSAIAAWQSVLASGVTRQAVVADFVESSEADFQIVGGFYLSYFHRPLEDPASDMWVQLLEEGDSASDVAVDMLSSEDYVQQTTPS